MADFEGQKLSRLLTEKPWEGSRRIASLSLEAGYLATARLRDEIDELDRTLTPYQGAFIALQAEFALQMDADTEVYKAARPNLGGAIKNIHVAGSFEAITVYDKDSWDWESELPYDQLEVCIAIDPRSEEGPYLVAPRHILGYLAILSPPVEEVVTA